ncbi:MAG TPA: hypothetical protein VH020_16635 [Stellaceae bacterium]|jgi:hypothetical protein|nr:hypothetical protein [Stellaceae bacterium]
MAYKPRFNSIRREKAWNGAKAAAFYAGLGSHPVCNLCQLPVFETDDWDESHDPAKPKCFGGRDTGVAHRRCNRDHGAKVVTPAYAEGNRVRRKAIGALKPGMGKSPMRGGRRDDFKIAVGGGRKPRLTNAERHREFLASRALRDDDGNPVGVWAPDPAHAED